MASKRGRVLATLVAMVATPMSIAGAGCSLTTIPDLTSGNGGSPDAAADGANGADGAAAVPFCRGLTPAPMFCDDFDDGVDLGKRWDSVHPFDGKLGVSLDPSVSRSTPNSLLARVDPGAGDCAYATVEKDSKGSFTATHLAYSVRLAGAADLPGKSAISAQSFGGGNTLCQVFLTATTPTTLSLGEQILHADGKREEMDYDVAPGLTVGDWTRVEIDYDLTAKRIAVTIDGKTALAVATALACPYAPGNVSALVGLFCAPSGTVTRKVHYDDVVIGWR